MRMAGSRDLGIGSNLLPYSILLVSAVMDYEVFCVSCQPSYVLLGLIIQGSISMSMASILVCPKTHCYSDDSLMQVGYLVYVLHIPSPHPHPKPHPPSPPD